MTTDTSRPKKKRSVNEFFSNRYSHNPYVRGQVGVAADINRNSPQMPKRMYKPKKVDPTKAELTEEEVDMLFAPPDVRKQWEQEKAKFKGEDPSRKHLRGVELVHRHRYGDDIDILRANFTKSVEDIEKEKFQLIVLARRLCSKIFWSLRTVPKHEKFVLGGNIRSSCIEVLKLSIALKKRFYRKNMLELIDVELDTLREYYRLAKEEYPTWVTEEHLQVIYNAINEVGAVVGGLMKSSVC